MAFAGDHVMALNISKESNADFELERHFGVCFGNNVDRYFREEGCMGS